MFVYAYVQVCIMDQCDFSSARGYLSCRHTDMQAYPNASHSVNVALITRLNYSSEPPRELNRWCHPGSAHSAMTMPPPHPHPSLSVLLFATSREHHSLALVEVCPGTENQDTQVLLARDQSEGTDTIWEIKRHSIGDIWKCL